MEFEMSKYKKESVNGWISLGTYPVYCEDILKGKTPFKVIGIRENEIEIEGDFNNGIHGIIEKKWMPKSKCFVIKETCKEQLKPSGCQVHNIYCCGGGSIITKHVRYWNK